jgi:hypothetical protein
LADKKGVKKMRMFSSPFLFSVYKPTLEMDSQAGFGYVGL